MPDNNESTDVTVTTLHSEYFTRNSDGTYTKHYFKTSASQIDGLEAALQRPTPTSFTIPVGSWVQNSNETSGYTYFADITVTGLTANDYAEVNFDRISLNEANSARICPSGETQSGAIRIFAKSAPNTALTGEYIIVKGADSNFFFN